MTSGHLTTMDVDSVVEGDAEAREQASILEHLNGCPACRARVSRGRRIEETLREMPRAHPPRDLSIRITGAVELRLAQEKARRDRLPLIIVATTFSVLLAAWFAIQMLVAIQVNGALDFISLMTSYPEVFRTYPTDAWFALVESLPISEIFLTLFAILTVVVLAQQWIDTVRPTSWRYH